MPTGYTAHIEDGSITTGKEFLLVCSRAFGVAVDLRDEPLSVPTPTHFEPNEYYKKRYENAEKELKEFKALSLEQVRSKMRSEHEKQVQDAESNIARMTEINRKYKSVRRQIEAWDPPTVEHIGIKEFALSQIDECVYSYSMFECYRKVISEPFCDDDNAVITYSAEHTKWLEQDAARAKDAYEKEVERAKQKTQFMKVFVESLESMK